MYPITIRYIWFQYQLHGLNALMEYTRVNIIVSKLFMANTILIAHVCVCVCLCWYVSVTCAVSLGMNIILKWNLQLTQVRTNFLYTVIVKPLLLTCGENVFLQRWQNNLMSY